MITCNEASEKILLNEQSEELSAHLAVCRECTMLADEWNLLKDNANRSSVSEPSLELDLRICSAAAKHIDEQRQHRRRKFFYWIPAAAAMFAVCFTVFFAVRDNNPDVIMNPGETKYSYWDAPESYAGLLMLSMEVESASDVLNSGSDNSDLIVNMIAADFSNTAYF